MLAVKNNNEMKNPEYITRKWERERKADIEHAERRIQEYKSSGNADAAAWWAERLEVLKRKTY